MSLDNQIRIDCDLDCPELPQSHRLNSVLAAANKSPLGSHQKDMSQNPAGGGFWEAGHFSLNKVTLFNDSVTDVQQEILRRCTQGLLEETYFIEKAGMTFAAKMVLLGESTQEKMLYSHFASDEAAHLQLIKSYLRQLPENIQHNEFLNLLTEVIETGDKACLIFVIQIILEGWGLNHYKALSLGCIDPDFKEAINFILKDEAQHYHSGVILFDSKDLSPRQENWILDILVRFFQMVQVGPQQVVSNLELVMGHFSPAQKARIFTELDCENHSAERLKILSNLIKNSPFIERLESYGVFRPWTPQQCAQLTSESDSSDNLPLAATPGPELSASHG